MGAFLTTSILTEFSIGKSNFHSLEGNDKKKIAYLEKILFNGESDLFDMSESEYGYDFKIKDEVIEKELLEFLKKFYADFHDDEEECDEIVKKLTTITKGKEFIGLAEESRYQNYQISSYGSMSIYYKKQRLGISYSSITIAMEGKIMMESYGRHFSFFEKLIQNYYSRFKLSNLIQIAIS